MFYYNGKQVVVEDDPESDRVVDGGICGGMGSNEVIAIAKKLLAAAKAGQTTVKIF